MKTFRTITVILLLSLSYYSCSSDDDSTGDSMPSTLELLTADTWYQESKNPGSFSDCEKNVSFKFNTDNTIAVEAYDDSTGTCESQGIINSTYSLNGSTITIALGTDTITASIISISETMLTITDSNGDTVVFDKTQG